MIAARIVVSLAALATAGLGAAGDGTVAPPRDRAAPGGADDAPAAVNAAQPPAAAPATQPPEARTPLLDLDGLRQARAAPPPAELFGAKSWYVAPPAPPAPPPPPPVIPKPTAPPLPFVFIGRMVEEGQATVFLMKGEIVHMVREGDEIDETYRVRRIEPGRLTLLYLPLQIEQTIAVEDPT